MWCVAAGRFQITTTPVDHGQHEECDDRDDGCRDEEHSRKRHETQIPGEPPQPRGPTLEPSEPLVDHQVHGAVRHAEEHE